MSEQSTSQTGGIGFLGALTILFVGLKLTGYIAWSWWWVLAAFWMPLLVVLVICAVMALVALGVAVFGR